MEEDGGALVERRVDREVVEVVEVEGEDGGVEREEGDVEDEVDEEILVSLFFLDPRSRRRDYSEMFLEVRVQLEPMEKHEIATDRRVSLVSLPPSGPRPPTAAAQP